LSCRLEELKQGKNLSLQQLLSQIIRNDTAKDNILSHLTSTCPWLLDFPQLENFFVDVKLYSRNSHWHVMQSRKLTETLFKRLKRRQLSVAERFMLLSAEPGKGKSFLTERISKDLRRRLPEFLVVHAKLIDYCQYLQDHPNITLLDFLKEVLNSRHFSTEQITDHMNKKQIAIFLDGFDEVCPDFRATVSKLFQETVKEEIFLWVSTRPQEEKEIKGKYQCITWTIQSLDVDSRVKLLSRRSKKPELECREIIDDLHLKGSWQLLDNPLHLSMLGEIFKSGELETVDLISIYERVLEMKTTDGLEKMGFSRSSLKFSIKMKSAIEKLKKFAIIYFGNKIISKEVNEEVVEF